MSIVSTILGSAANLLDRVRKVLPRRWFQWAPPIRDALNGGLSVSAAWNYGLIGYAKAQTRLATAYGVWLDIFARDYLGPTLIRNGLPDPTFQALIKATILQPRVTRAGMINAIAALTGKTPKVFEPWNTFDTGAYSAPAGGPKYGSMGYGVGRGGYGNMRLPGQAFVTVTRGSPSGVPGVGGYGNNAGGYGAGAVEYVGSEIALTGVTDDLIYQIINITKPTGSTMWTAIN